MANGTLRLHNNELSYVGNRNGKQKFPKSIFFIVTTEFCERFNYIGMRAVLVLYFSQKLLLDEDTATVYYHASAALLLSMCIFGALVSDSWLGKYKTILYFSSIYAIGSVALAIGAIPAFNSVAKEVTFIALLLTAIGCGGIKPCVTGFGGDQFKLPEQAAQMAIFFSVFIFSIHCGAFLSTILTPILRQDVHCFGEEDCYSLAFAVPAVLMAIAMTSFVCGKPLYTINMPTENMLVQVTKCITNAISSRCRNGKMKHHDHWLDYSEQKYGGQLVCDIKVLLRVLVVYIPMPLLWALCEQQGSRWTFQATRMDGDIGIYNIKPDQLHAISALLGLFLIPFIGTVINPLLARVGIRTLMQKLGVGMFLVAFSFLLAGIVELQLEKTYPVLPADGQAHWRLINGLPCNFTVTTNIPSNERFTLDEFRMFEGKNIRVRGFVEYAYALTATRYQPTCPQRIDGKIEFESNTATTAFISGGSATRRQNVYAENPQKSRTGAPMLRVMFSSFVDAPIREIMIRRSDGDDEAYLSNSTNRERFAIHSGRHDIYIDGVLYGTITLRDGSVSTLVVFEKSRAPSFDIRLVEITSSNTMSMLWLVPQFVIIGIGEVMCITAGLEFSYTEAPASLKSVVIACWALAMSLGNFIVVIISGVNLFESQADEFFLFGGSMVLNTILFIFLAKNYKRESKEHSVNTSNNTAIQS